MITEPTPKQREVLMLILKGYDLKEIAIKLNRSIKMIEVHTQNLRDLFEVKTTIGLIVESSRYAYLYNELRFHREHGILIEETDVLTDFEKSVLHGLLKGKKNKEIAQKLKAKVRFVEYTRGKIIEKWNVDSKVDLVLKSISKNYLQLRNCAEVINGENEQEILKLFRSDSTKAKFLIPKYELIYGSPSKTYFRLSDIQKEVLRMTLLGNDIESIGDILKISDYKTLVTLAEVKGILGTETIAELIVMSISMGIIVIDNWQDVKFKSLKRDEIRQLLQLSHMSDVSLHYGVIGSEENDASIILTRISELWGMYSVEGILVDALKRGDIDITELIRGSNNGVYH